MFVDHPRIKGIELPCRETSCYVPRADEDHSLVFGFPELSTFPGDQEKNVTVTSCILDDVAGSGTQTPVSSIHWFSRFFILTS
jgi:hypothetical protein